MSRLETRPGHPAISAADRRGREGPELPGRGPGARGGRGHGADLAGHPARRICPAREERPSRGAAARRPADGRPAGDLAAAVRGDLALHAEPARGGSPRHPVDLAYVSMLKHDAYVAVEAGRRQGFPVVLRPEGAGATGDLAWQAWGNFGRQDRRAVPAGRRLRRDLAGDRARAERRRATTRPGFMRCPTACRCPRVPGSAGPTGGRPRARSSSAGWRPRRASARLIDAWPRVRTAHPEARLTLIGEGPERPALEAQARSLGLGLGPGPGGRASRRGGRRDRGASRRRPVRPALAEEGMSIALLEAMALGIPLVASSIPGNRRLVSDFKHGRLAPPEDPAALARVIVEQWADFDRAFHMSRAARQPGHATSSRSPPWRASTWQLFETDPGTTRGMIAVLKVLQLIPTLDRSGAEKQMVLLAKGLPRDRFQVEVATLTRLGPLEAELEAAGIPVTAIGKRFKLDPLALARLVAVPQGRAVRRGPDLDLRGQHLRPGRGPPGQGAGRGHDRDGRGPLEGKDRATRSTAGWRVVRPAGGQLARRGRVLPTLGRARRPAGDDLLGDRRRRAAAGRSRRGPRGVRLRGRRAAGPLRRPAGRAEAGRRPAQGARPAPARPARPPHPDRRRRAAAIDGSRRPPGSTTSTAGSGSWATATTSPG